MAEETTQSARSLRVLLVDDEASLREPLAKRLAKEWGYQVTQAAHAKEAHRLLSRARRPFDVALVDDLLAPVPREEPEYLGIALLEEIKERWPQTEVVIFTGWGTERALGALQAGAYRYLAKPVDLDELGMVIRAAAQQVRLREIGQAVLSERELPRVLELIEGAACSLALADEAAIVLLDPSSDRLQVYETHRGDRQWFWHFKGQNLSREIIRSGKVVRVPDTTMDDQVDELVIESGTRSFLGVPVPGEEGNRGVLYVYSRQAGRFDAWGTVAVLQTLAGQASVAIANADAFRQIHAHAGYTEALVRASRGLTRAATEEEQLNLAWEFVREQLGVTTFFVGLYDRPADTLRFPLSYEEGSPDDIPERYLGDDPKQWGLSGHVVKTGQECYWPTDQEREKECAASGVTPIPVGPPCESCFFLPLKKGDETVGLLSMQSYDRHAFDPIELDACRALGSQLVVAMENAQLLEGTRRTSAEMSALNEVVLRMGGELERRPLLDSIIAQAVDLLEVEGGGVYLLDPTGETRTMVASAGLDLELMGQPLSAREGFFCEIMRRDRPCQISEYHRWEGRLPSLDRYLLTCVAGARIRVGQRTLGALILHDTRPRREFDDAALALLEQFANHAGLALQKVELLDKLRAVERVSTAIASRLELSVVLSDTCRAAAELFEVDHGGLVLFDADLEWGTVEAEWPSTPNTLGTRIPVKGVPAEEKLTGEGRVLQFDDVEKAESELGPVLGILRGFDIRSILLVPIVYQDRVLGSFSLDAVGCTREFTPTEIELCQTFAAHVAVAVENARLFSQLQQTTEQREALVESSFDAVIAIDQETKKVQVFNNQATEMLGWTLEEMQGHSADRLHTDLKKARQIYEAVSRDGMIERWEVTLKHKDGALVPALLSARLIRGSDGHPTMQAGFMRDLRRVRLLEKRQLALIEVSKAITGTLAQSEVLDRVAQKARDAFPAADGGAIHLYDKKAGLLRVAADTTTYSAEAAQALVLQVGEGIAGWVFENRQPCLVPDALEDSRYKRIAHAEVRDHRSMMCVPLQVGEETAGTLSLSNKEVVGAFDPEDLGLLRSFADQAAIAIENARRMEKLEAIRRAAEAMARTLEPKPALQQIVESAVEVLGADSAAIWSYDQARDEFVSDELVAEGIPADMLERLRDEEDRPGQTAREVMRQGYVPVVDLERGERRFLGQSTREALDRLGVRSFQGVALQVGDTPLGVLYANYNHAHAFGEDEKAALKVLASHAALTLKKARLLEQLRQARDTAGTVAQMTVLGDRQATLKSVAQGVQDVVDCDAVTLYAYDETNGTLDHPPTTVGLLYPERAARLGEVAADSIVYHMLLRDEPYIVEVVAEDDLFRDRRFAQDEAIESCVAIPLKALDQRVGVMFVNYRSLHRFSRDELANMLLFADQAAVAIYNAQQYEELKRTRGLVGARTALAWMNMASGAWRHAIDKHALTIREQSKLLRGDLQRWLPPEHLSQTDSRITMIQRLATQIRQKPITPPLGAEEGVIPVAVNDLIGERVRQLRKSYTGVKFQTELLLDNTIAVRASPEWLRRAFDILVDNAAEAVAHGKKREITAVTREWEGRVEILVSDTGPGIPEEMKGRLGLEPIEKGDDAKGLGMGLLMAGAIAQAYEGDIRLEETGPSGTTMVISLPLPT